MGLIGNLKVDSPGLIGAFTRVLHRDFVELLGEVYASVVALGGLKEFPVVRRESDSFNPRPARICQILLKEARECDARVFAAAMLCCADSLPQEELIDGSHQLVERVRRTQQQERSFVVDRIRLAMMVDRVRHLHMSDVTYEVARLEVEDARKLVAIVCDPDNLRLKRILEVSADNTENLLRELKYAGEGT